MVTLLKRSLAGGGPASPSRMPRSSADEWLFRDAFWLLVTFGVCAVPASLLLVLMGLDFLEGDAGFFGTIVMFLAGNVSLACGCGCVLAQKARKGDSLVDGAFCLVWSPLLVTLVALFAAILAMGALLHPSL